MRRRTPTKERVKLKGTLLAGWLHEPDAAAAVNLTEKTFINYRKLRIGPTFTLVGRKYMYSPDSLKAWLAAGGKQQQSA